MEQIVLFTIKEGTTIFVKTDKNKFWKEHITKNKNVLTNKELVLTVPFKVKDYLVFKKGNWLLAVNMNKVEEESFVEVE